MPRTVSEIEAEMSAAKAEGVHAQSAKMRALRAERDAVKAAPMPGDAPPATVTLPAGTVVVGEETPVCAESDPYKTAEWEFIQQAIAETEVDFKSGAMTGVAKKMFNILDMKVRLWRMAREMVAQVGIGADWPQWAALGRDENTGQKIATRPAPPARPVDPVPAVTEGGMPIRPKVPTPAADELEAERQKIKQSMLGMLGQRPAPERAPEAAAV